MNKIINYIIWPAVSGLVFGFVLLQLPRLAEHVPALQAYFPKETVQQITTNSFSYSDAFSKTAPAVVSINLTADIARPADQRVFNPFRRQILLYDESTSLGSGVIISADGYIITSFHIFEIAGADAFENSVPEITVTLYNGQTMEARPIIFDKANDLALLKVDATDLAYITSAEESSLDAGDIVLAIGNPRNIGQSVTLGIISALLKTEDSYVIQTDAAINPGSSGGALIDVDGKLIGINSTIVTESGGSEGISFAIPASKAFELMSDYLERGPGGYLGVDGEFVNLMFSRMFLESDTEGMWIESLSANGPADKAGLKANDIIISLAEIEITSQEAALYAVQTINNMSPGETVVARVNREGEIVVLPIVLGVGEAIIWLTDNEPLLDPSPFSANLLR